jgi:hypothetical protein
VVSSGGKGLGGRLAARRSRALGAAVAACLVAFAVRAPARAETELVAGTAAATATVAEINIPYGGANIGTVAGLSNASYFEGSAKASSVTFEPSFLRLAAVFKFCGGGFPVTLPPPTEANTNDAGGPVAHHKEGAPGLGVEDAAAEPGSHGHSTVTTGVIGLPGVVEGSGGAAQTDARLDPGAQARTTRAEVRMGELSLAGGLVKLSGLRWTSSLSAVGADHRSIQEDQTSGFELGSMTLAGLPLPTGTTDALASSVASVNQVLAPMGIQLRLPEVKPFGERGVQVTPLTIALGGDPVYGPALFSLLGGPDNTSLVSLYNTITQPTLIEPATCNSLFGLLKLAPETNTLVNTLGTLAPIVLSAVAAAVNGGAEVDVNVGGTRSSYDATYFEARGVAPTPPAASAPAAPSGGGQPAAIAPSGATELAGSPTKVSTSCATTSPVGRPGCWKGSGPIAATLAAAVTVGLFATDELGRRRRRARSTEETT